MVVPCVGCQLSLPVLLACSTLFNGKRNAALLLLLLPGEEACTPTAALGTAAGGAAAAAAKLRACKIAHHNSNAQAPHCSFHMTPCTRAALGQRLHSAAATETR